MRFTYIGRTSGAALPLCFAAALAVPGILRAQAVTVREDGSAVYQWNGTTSIAGQGHLYTNAVSSNDPDVANIVGANRFYIAGYNGFGAVVANIEAGHLWNGHETLTHATARAGTNPGAPGFTPAYDRHATSVGMAIGGRPNGNAAPVTQRGIAYNVDLRSGAIALSWKPNAYSTSFSTNNASLAAAYASNVTGFGAAGVINSSWGYSSASGSAESAGIDVRSMLIDSLANANRLTTFVASVGNGGAMAMVSAPASGFNGISVGALQNGGTNKFESVASFSSGGPADYRDAINGHVGASTARRAVVDIVAPGTHLTTAAYGGQTGGNDSSLPGSTPIATGPTWYTFVEGTSYAAPVVSGGVALMQNAAQSRNMPTDARDTRVIKAALLNSATKIAGWDNGQVIHPNGHGGVRTTQALDFRSGAGALNLNKTFDQYLNGQTDLSGMTGGVTSKVTGWDYASVDLGGNTDIVISTPMEGELRVTLDWFRDRSYVDATTQIDVGFANLDLQVWDSTFSTLIADSISDYNEVEHLAFDLPAAGQYGLRIVYASNVFGSLTSEEFGIAWAGAAAVPEPAGLAAALSACAGLTMRRRRRH